MSSALDMLLLAQMQANHHAGKEVVSCEIKTGTFCDGIGNEEETHPCMICGLEACDECQWHPTLAEIEGDRFLSGEELSEKYQDRKVTPETWSMLFLKDTCICVKCTRRN